MQSPPFPRYLVPPRSKYSPQHPLNRGLLGKKNTIDTRYTQKPSVSYMHYISHSIPHHKISQMNFNINMCSPHSNTSEDACLPDIMLHHWASSHIYKDKSGLAYMVKQMKEDPRRLAFSTLMSLIFYVL